MESKINKLLWFTTPVNTDACNTAILAILMLTQFSVQNNCCMNCFILFTMDYLWIELSYRLTWTLLSVLNSVNRRTKAMDISGLMIRGSPDSVLGKKRCRDLTFTIASHCPTDTWRVKAVASLNISLDSEKTKSHNSYCTLLNSLCVPLCESLPGVHFIQQLER